MEGYKIEWQGVMAASIANEAYSVRSLCAEDWRAALFDFFLGALWRAGLCVGTWRRAARAWWTRSAFLITWSLRP